MEHDASDILGHTSLPVALGKNSGASSFSMGQLVSTGVVLLVVYMVAKRLWKRALLWQEQSYKLATRRRHGIPDSDLRPFNVAYSAAITRAREEESRNQVKSNPSLRPQGRLLDQHDPEQTLRYRMVPQQKIGTHLEAPTVLGPITLKTSASSSKSANPPASEQTFMNRYVPRQPIIHSAQASSSTAPPRPLTRQAAYSHLEDLTSDSEGRKRSLDEQGGDEHEPKKSRVDGEELIDGDEDAEFYHEGHSAPKRGSKRGFGEEDDREEVTEIKKFRGKRARKVSQEKARQSHVIDDNMDISDEELDEITELTSRSRGKKRDRAEAGSTFGGDDDDSAAELEPEDDIKARRRRRKRRTVAKRKSEASHSRGKKRDRDADDEKSDLESEDGSQRKVSRKKRGKRGFDRHDNEHTSRSDVSMDSSINSTRGKVRAIGEEWESNGIKYKVGPNSQRLRQALVKQARQKFVMPIDSQHSDRNANVQICIECWLTEEEYQEKKAEHMLAWQDGTPPRQEEPVNNLSLDVAEPQLSQSVAGKKNLFWGSSTASTPTASPASHSPATEVPPESAKPRGYRDSYRHSIATVGLPISPFCDSQMPTVKRIASTTRASLSSGHSGSPGLSDNTNGSPRTVNKVFSKWEKQELEAQAIMKMREANRKKELEREAKLKEEKEKAERAAAERARLEKERLDKEQAEKERIEREKAEAERKAREAAQVPKITITAPSSDNITAPTTSTSTTGVPNFFSMTPTGSTAAKPMENATTSQSTSIPSFFSNNSAPAANLAQAEPTKSQSPFSFSAPSESLNTGNAAASSSAPKPGIFSFPTTVSSTGGQKMEGSLFSAPLLSRVGPQASTSSPEPSKPTPAPLSQQPFSFNKPNSPNSMTSNRSQTMQTPPAQPTASSSSTAATSTNAPPLKFTFNVPSKPTAPNPAAAASTTAFPASSPSSLSGALGSDQQKTTTSSSNAPTFNFKLPTTPASASNTTSTTPTAATTSAPKFTFGTSAFKPSVSSSGPSEQSKEPFKSFFGNTNTASAFSSNTGIGSSPFGGNTSFQVQNKEPFKTSFGGNTSTFANNAGMGSSPFDANSSAIPSQNQKSVFGGGSTNTTTAFSNNTGTSASLFGANSSTSQGQKSAFGGGGTNTTTAFPDSTGTNPPPFGLPQTQTQNVFGGGVFGSNPTETPKSVFGNGTPTSTPTTSVPANTSNTTNTTTTPKFSFPVNNQTGTSTTMTTTPSGTPASGSGAFSFGLATTTPQPSPFGTSSFFGNTAPGGTSSNNGTTTTPSVFGVFGAPASQQQK